jgi:hypothetical protein
MVGIVLQIIQNAISIIYLIKYQSPHPQIESGCVEIMNIRFTIDILLCITLEGNVHNAINTGYMEMN